MEIVEPERITVRVPLIPEFNTEDNEIRSRNLLQTMGVVNFDLFTYKTHTLDGAACDTCDGISSIAAKPSLW